MNIGIDARKIRDFGVGLRIEHLIKYLPEFDTEDTYVIFHASGDADIVPQTGSNIRLVTENSPKYSLRELLIPPFKMAQQRLDLFHAPHYTLPPIRPCKGIVTIHDVIHLRFREYLPHPLAYYYAKGMMWAAARSAKKVITVSDCSKQDITRYLGVPEHKIEVIYNGIDVQIPQECREAVKQRSPELPDRLGLRQQFGISRPYILYLSNFMPHKNFETLIRAYGILKQRYQTSHCLVLAGKNEKLRQQLQRLIQQEALEQDVLLTGFVEDCWKSRLYACADLFVYPSLYDGFGLQALEAMVYELPVVISDISALTEVAGDAALRCDPNSPEDMAVAMHKVLHDQSLRQTLVERGKARLSHFSWREMARKTVEIYQKVLSLK